MAADDYLGISNQTQKRLNKKEDETRFTKILHVHLKLCDSIDATVIQKIMEIGLFQNNSHIW